MQGDTPAKPAPLGSGAPRCEWIDGSAGRTLVLEGDWRQDTLPSLTAPDASRPLSIDARGVTGWDGRLAAELWAMSMAGELRPDARALPEGLGELLALAGPSRPQASGARPEVPASRPRATIVCPGEAAPAPAPSADASPPGSAHLTIRFLGDVLIAVGRLSTARARLPAGSLLAQLDRTGARSVPIVVLTCALVGLMLAYMGGAQLGRIGAQRYLADVVTVGMIRELAGLMTGVILAGRLGAGFAAELAAMNAGEEIDALRVLGVDPIAHLVLPRLLALIAISPLLIAFGAAAGIVAGWPAAVWAYGVTSGEYLHQSLRAITFTHLWIGFFKGVVYAALVALAGCRDGLHAGRSAEQAGQATTAAVVRALVWIVCAACGTTVVFTSLGY
ncbi:MAG: hypothetical protein RIS35_2055 [Pseudomonadota bacterium]